MDGIQLSSGHALQITRVADTEVETALGLKARSRDDADNFAYDVLNRRVRRVVTRSSKARKGYLSSPKNGAVIAWESPLERDAVRLLECDPTVSAYWTQPFAVRFRDPEAGQWRQHTPDILAYRCGRPVVIEIKDETKAARDAIARRLTTIREAFAADGLEYRIWTQKVIRQEPRLSNAIWLLRYRGEEVSPGLHLLAIGLLQENKTLRRSELERLLVTRGAPRNRLTPKIMALLLHGRLRLALSEHVAADPLLTLP